MNFTDNPQAFQFTPFVDTLATDALVRTEMEKQRQFDMGVQKVQSYVDQTLALPIAKAETQEYVKGKLEQLKQHLSSSVTGDFSDGRLINQVGGLTGRIANDPIVQNGVQSTLKAQSALKQIEEDRKAGKLSVQNEYDFMNGYTQWLGDGRADTAFEGSYSPYIDKLKAFVDAYNDATKNVDERVTQDAFRIGTDGKPEINPAMMETTMKGVTPDKVASIWNMVASKPEIQNQLRIDANYEFRGYSPEQLAKYHRDSYEQTLSAINKQVEDIQLKLTTDKTFSSVEATQLIDELKKQGSSLVKQYEQGAKLLTEGNLEGFKAYSYAGDFQSSLLRNFSWSKREDKYLTNPFFTAQMSTLNYELETAKFAYQKEHDKIKDNLDMLKTLKGKKGDGEQDGLDFQTTAGNISAEEGKKGSVTFDQGLQASKSELSQSMSELVFTVANRTGGMNPIKIHTDGSYVYNIDPTGKDGYKSIPEAKAAWQKIYTESRTSIMEGKAPLDVQRIFNNNIDPLVRDVRNRETKQKEIEERYKPRVDVLFKELTKAGLPKEITLTGDRAGTKVDIRDLVDYYTVNEVGGTAGESAKKRIEGRFGADGVEFLKGNINFSKSGLGVPQLNKQYSELKKVLKDKKEVISVYQEREQAFKDAQLSYLPKNTTILANKAADKEDVRQRYVNIATSMGKGNNSSEVKDFLSWIGKEGNTDDKLVGSNVYGFYKDGNDVYLTVQRGQESRQIKVTEQELSQIPGAVVQNQFWNRFGKDLELTKNTSTDVTKGRAATAYIMERQPDSKYNVQFHVLGNGKGSYDLQLFVRDGKGKMILDGVSPGLNTDMQGIMNALSELKNDTIIDGLISVHNP